MPPLAAHPAAHCSTTRMRSRVGFGSRSKLPTPNDVPLALASSSSRLVHGDNQVTCQRSSGRPRTPTALGEMGDGSAGPGAPPVQRRHNDCSPQKPPILLRGVPCHVSRALAFSYV